MMKIGLVKMCQPPEEGKAFFRPLICKGDLSNIDIFFVGINPATPIFPSNDMDMEKYVDLICHYDQFIDYYKKQRERHGKSEYSRTRIGINSFLSWLATLTSSTIAETNVIAYPTENLKKLQDEPSYIIERSKEIFFELLQAYEPSLLLLHGKITVETFGEILAKKNIEISHNADLDLSIQQMETKAPLFSFVYPSKKPCSVLACRHFMYYGSVGNSFAEFKRNISKMIRETRV